MTFNLNQNSLEAVQEIVKSHQEIIEINLIAHTVNEEIKFRKINKTNKEKAKNITKSFEHEYPLRIETYSRFDFLKLTLATLPLLKQNEVWSVSSKVKCSNEEKHIPMMNFHPETVNKREIISCLGIICKNKSGVLVDSGRFYHYYGNFLLNQREWEQFLGEFLMPCVLVSPRYIGHMLHYGSCTLRLTNDKQYKPKIPKVIKIINP
jgi:hypothetical protein